MPRESARRSDPHRVNTPRGSRSVVAAVALVVAAAACRTAPVVEVVAAQEALFHAEPRWLGGDAAYSTLLPDGRVLWLFGDSFVAVSGAHVRREARMPHNTIAIQSAADPDAASMHFFWRDDPEGKPTSFFADPSADRWLWPGAAVVVDGKLLVFLVEIGRSEGGLGFTTGASRAVLVEDTTGDPTGWTFADVAVPPNPWGAPVGFGAALVDGEHLVCFAPREPGDHAIFVARYDVADAARGDLSSPQWLQDGAWRAQADVDGEPTAAWTQGQTELSVHKEAATQRFVAISVDGFGGTNVVARTAERIEGPWSTTEVLFRPEESDRANILVYSAKAHPWLPGPIVVTYSTNTTDFAALVGDTTLYFPRAVRVRPASP